MDRIISGDWSDDEYNVELEDDEYRIWDLIVKNTNRIGMAKVPKSLMCWRAKRMNPKRYDEIVKKLETDGKLIVDNGYYIVVNHYKHWDYSRPTGAKGALLDLKSVLNEITHTAEIVAVVNELCKRIEQQSSNNKNVEEITTLVEQVLNSCSMVVEQHEREREREKEIRKEKKEIPPTPSLVSEVEAEIEKIRKLAVGVKLICNLNNDQKLKLIELYGLEKLRVMLGIYYKWKMSKQAKRNDYLTMINGWVEEEANKRMAEAPSPPKPQRTDLPPEWATWTQDQRREYNIKKAGAK